MLQSICTFLRLCTDKQMKRSSDSRLRDNERKVHIERCDIARRVEYSETGC